MQQRRIRPPCHSEPGNSYIQTNKMELRRSVCAQIDEIPNLCHNRQEASTMKAISIIFLTSFATFGFCDAALRTTKTKNEKEVNPWEALQDWNHDFEPYLDHGRKLFTTFDECFSATNSAALCSCVFLDGNDFEYCQICGGSLLAANFNLDDVARFSEWLSDETVLNLAQTGTYVVSINNTPGICRMKKRDRRSNT